MGGRSEMALCTLRELSVGIAQVARIYARQQVQVQEHEHLPCVGCWIATGFVARVSADCENSGGMALEFIQESVQVALHVEVSSFKVSGQCATSQRCRSTPNL